MVMFVNWEFRPAVLLDDGRAFAILREGGDWSEVNRAEVIDSGAVMLPERFAARFPEADHSRIPRLTDEWGNEAPE